MKILLLTDCMNAGGAETHIALLARGLVQAGDTVSLLSAGGKAADALASEGVRQFRIPVTKGSWLRFLSADRQVSRLLKNESFDLLHAHTRRTALFLRGKRCLPPIAVTVHAAYEPLTCFPKLGYWGDRTIAVSEDLRARLCDRFSVPAEKITVIPNGIDCTQFMPSEKEPPHGSILFVSRLDEDCSLGADLLCSILPRLIASFPDLHITLAGGGNALNRIRRRVAACNRTVGKEVICAVGHMREMPMLYRNHSITVGVSRVAMEAAACGSAVILCGNEGYGGILSKDSPAPALSNFCCRGFFPPSEEALFCDLSRLLRDNTSRREIALFGREWILSEFSSDRMIEETRLFYGRLVSLKKSPMTGVCT